MEIHEKIELPLIINKIRAISETLKNVHWHDFDEDEIWFTHDALNGFGYILENVVDSLDTFYLNLSESPKEKREKDRAGLPPLKALKKEE